MFLSWKVGLLFSKVYYQSWSLSKWFTWFSFINISDNKNFAAKMEVGFVMELGLYSYHSETREGNQGKAIYREQ